MWSIDLHTFTKKAAHTKGSQFKMIKYNRHIEYLALGRDKKQHERLPSNGRRSCCLCYVVLTAIKHDSLIKAY